MPWRRPRPGQGVDPRWLPAASGYGLRRPVRPAVPNRHGMPAGRYPTQFFKRSSAAFRCVRWGWGEEGGNARRRDAAMSGGVGGLISISIDLELDPQYPHRLEPCLDAVRQELIDLFACLGIPATWAVADPLYSAATESILRAGKEQEIAVLGEEAWLGPGCGRLRLARELARRFAAARQAGIPATTLAIRNVSRMPEPDLLREHGVQAICPPAVSPAPRPSCPGEGLATRKALAIPCALALAPGRRLVVVEGLVDLAGDPESDRDQLRLAPATGSFPACGCTPESAGLDFSGADPPSIPSTGGASCDPHPGGSGIRGTRRIGCRVACPFDRDFRGVSGSWSARGDGILPHNKPVAWRSRGTEKSVCGVDIQPSDVRSTSRSSSENCWF